MGKAKRLKRQRATTPRRRLVVVDGCEVGQIDGMLTMRVGPESRPAVCIAVPAERAAVLVQHLRLAVLDAEETYWQTVPALLRDVAPGDVATSTATLRAWVLEQDWITAVDNCPAEEDETFLLSFAGHVGLAIAPPFIDRPTVAIFDPTQLRRLAPSLQSTTAAAAANVQPEVSPRTVTAVREFLVAQPWPPPGHLGPTSDEARAVMRRQHTQFLARNPYLRPEPGWADPDHAAD